LRFRSVLLLWQPFSTKPPLSPARSFRERKPSLFIFSPFQAGIPPNRKFTIGFFSEFLYTCLLAFFTSVSPGQRIFTGVPIEALSTQNLSISKYLFLLIAVTKMGPHLFALLPLPSPPPSSRYFPSLHFSPQHYLTFWHRMRVSAACQGKQQFPFPSVVSLSATLQALYVSGVLLSSRFPTPTLIQWIYSNTKTRPWPLLSRFSPT